VEANVLFSACRPEAGLRRLLRDAARRGQLVASETVIVETRRNLAAKKPEWLFHLSSVLADFGEITRKESALAADLPVKDLPILGAAVAESCTHLLTGDRAHFGKHYGQHLHGVKIVNPVQLDQELFPQV
jgi:hypothetical protein